MPINGIPSGQLPSTVPIPFAELSGVEAAGAAAAVLAQDFSPWEWNYTAAPADTVRKRFAFPAASTKVASIRVTAVGTKPTAGTIAVTKGVAAGGNTMLNAATVTLSAVLSDNTITPLTLTGTATDLQGGLTDGGVVEMVNVDTNLVITVVFGRQ